MEIWVALSLPLGKLHQYKVICVLFHSWWDAEVRNCGVSYFHLLAFFLPAYVWEVVSDSICSKSGDAVELSSQQLKTWVKVTDGTIIWEQDAVNVPPWQWGMEWDDL